MVSPTPCSQPHTRRGFTVQGQVQGVGFRPFVFVLAKAHGLSGFVGNTPQGVRVEVQGPHTAVAAFAAALPASLPPLARITALHETTLALVPGESKFVIAKSTGGTAHNVLVSPDVGLCAECEQEITTPGNRREGYAFTNCTHCGPRYSITRTVPYDRPSTTMACFPLCPACRAEYENPHDRRFHAQPNACPVCGPSVWFVQGSGGAPQTTGPHTALQSGAPTGKTAVAQAAQLLAGGNILAMKGLGGFHLVCDARQPHAVAHLRERKQRPHKPLALMVPTLAVAEQLACVSKGSKRLLVAPERPIVLCALKKRWRNMLAGIAPGIAHVGIMLPYTPLHVVLFQAVAHAQDSTMLPPVLVMTSGNPKGEPICLGNREALIRLAPLAHGFLLHNRDILVRVDDSVVRHVPGSGTLYFRRARGYAPRPLALPNNLFGVAHNAGAAASGEQWEQPQNEKLSDNTAQPQNGEPCDKTTHPQHGALPVVLGVGADLKNTLCVSKGGYAFVSQYIGDMENAATAAFHEEIQRHVTHLLGVQPTHIAADAHPGYVSRALTQEAAMPVTLVQHHAAHAFAVLAENNHTGPALVLALDGTGFGADGTLWGGEVLLAHLQKGTCQRVAHLAPLRLPGGEAAIREPWRIAHALLLELGQLATPTAPVTRGGYPLPWRQGAGVRQKGGALQGTSALGAEGVSAGTITLLNAMLENNVHCPTTTSAGRWFDAVAALMGVCLRVTYEGQAAILLEASGVAAPFMPHTVPQYGLDTRALFLSVLGALEAGEPLPRIAATFHHAFASGLVHTAAEYARIHGVRHVAFTGGCLQNVLLLRLLQQQARANRLVPLLHKQLPPNDGCIAFGQVVYTLCQP